MQMQGIQTSLMEMFCKSILTQQYGNVINNNYGAPQQPILMPPQNSDANSSLPAGQSGGGGINNGLILALMQSLSSSFGGQGSSLFQNLVQ
jgi:hypothetical protein